MRKDLAGADEVCWSPVECMLATEVDSLESMYANGLADAAAYLVLMALPDVLTDELPVNNAGGLRVSHVVSVVLGSSLYATYALIRHAGGTVKGSCLEGLADYAADRWVEAVVVVAVWVEVEVVLCMLEWS